MNNVLTYKPKNKSLACFIFALVAIAIGGALCWWMSKLSILYVALSVILIVWGVGCWIKSLILRVVNDIATLQTQFFI